MNACLGCESVEGWSAHGCTGSDKGDVHKLRHQRGLCAEGALGNANIGFVVVKAVNAPSGAHTQGICIMLGYYVLTPLDFPSVHHD